jgi:lysozyme family protein
MQSVRDIASAIVAREGGYVDDPDDPGGATKYGVTIHTMRRLGLDLDGDGDVDRDDVRRITAAHATDIFIEHYFERPRIGDLPEVLQPSVFDMYVNAGSNAVRILQRLLRRMGHDIAVDGIIGPHTIRAAHVAAKAAPDHLADAYGIARRSYYYRLADRRPASRKYARRRDGGKGGWILRAETFIAPRYHLSAAQHRERVAAWD